MVGNDCCNCSVKNGEMCPRHNIRKSEEWITLCRTDPVYFQAWEGGWGPGQYGTRPVPSTETKPPRKSKCSSSHMRRPSYAEQMAKQTPAAKAKKQMTGLGDLIEGALSKVGITHDRVDAWLGRPCGCPERKARLNALFSWARASAETSIEESAARAQEIFKS